MTYDLSCCGIERCARRELRHKRFHPNLPDERKFRYKGNFLGLQVKTKIDWEGDLRPARFYANLAVNDSNSSIAISPKEGRFTVDWNSTRNIYPIGMISASGEHRREVRVTEVVTKN